MIQSTIKKIKFKSIDVVLMKKIKCFGLEMENKLIDWNLLINILRKWDELQVFIIWTMDKKGSALKCVL